LQENLVKKVCREFNITQKELADMLDIPHSTIGRWASTGNIPKTAKLALELLLENKKLKKQVEVLKLLKQTLNEL